MNLTWKWMEFKMLFSTTWISKTYWSLQHRFNPKHRYNIVRLTRLEPGYYDPDCRLFYAMFEVFEDFMKDQFTNPIVVWDYDESCFPDFMVEEDPEGVKKEIDSRNARWKEMKEIYNWWVNDYQNREDTLPELPDHPKEWGPLGWLKEEHKDSDYSKEFSRICKIHSDQEEVWKLKDKEMMHRLVDIHESLWD